MSRMPRHRLGEPQRKKSPVRSMGDLPVVKKQAPGPRYSKSPAARPSGWRRQQYLVAYDHTLHIGTQKCGALAEANMASPRRSARGSRAVGSRGTPRPGYQDPALDPVQQLAPSGAAAGDDTLGEWGEAGQDPVAHRARAQPAPALSVEQQDEGDGGALHDAGGRPIQSGDKVRVFCPKDLYPPEHPVGTVTGYSRGRVGVQLDTGLQKGVARFDLQHADDDDDEEGTHWEKMFPVGTPVVILEPPEGGDPNHGEIGTVTGLSRGRVGVEFGDGTKGGYTEAQLQPYFDDECEDECVGAEMAKAYAIGTRVEVVDAADAHHGCGGVVAGTARGRIGVQLHDGRSVGLAYQQLFRCGAADEDPEEPDLGSRWKVGDKVVVTDPPMCGKNHNKAGVVRGHSNGRVGVEVSGYISGEVHKCTHTVGVVGASLRVNPSDDADEEEAEEAAAKQMFPVGCRVHVLGLDPTSMDGRLGIVTGSDKSRGRVGVTMADDGTVHGLLPGQLIKEDWVQAEKKVHRGQLVM